MPVWAYFAVADASAAGATLGKRLTRICVRRTGGGRIRFGTALARTALKLMPWELAHLLGFALVDGVSDTAQLVGLVAANVLMLGYLGVRALTRGEQSMHDLVVGTVATAECS
ncbi:MAG: RDD family protein [Anaerolineae bacterium]|nr:RDD family protein [Anaerolineae bacterium]